ncbi:hypothetical protein IAD21_03185 [Abditibacteriota bacterium]|nr:hypothetical protein IAD21_03185 [Abditibacteriota bacterium]
MFSRGQVERAEHDMNALTARINETVKHRQESDAKWNEWKKATHAFHTYFHENPVFLLWRRETLDAIRAGDRNTIEGSLTFLEADPYFFRSGYLKEKVLRAIKRAPLNGRDEVRVQMIILRALEGRYKREFKFYARLIPRIYTPQFENELRVAAKRTNCHNHAHLVLNALDNHC